MPDAAIHSSMFALSDSWLTISSANLQVKIGFIHHSDSCSDSELSSDISFDNRSDSSSHSTSDSSYDTS